MSTRGYSKQSVKIIIRCRPIPTRSKDQARSGPTAATDDALVKPSEIDLRAPWARGAACFNAMTPGMPPSPPSMTATLGRTIGPVGPGCGASGLRDGSKLLISARRRATDRRLVFVVVVTALARQVDLARPSTSTAHDIAIAKCERWSRMDVRPSVGQERGRSGAATQYAA